MANEQKDTWEHLHAAFKDRYVAINEHNQPALIAKGELFNNLGLSPGQALEEYHSIVIEKGVQSQKPERQQLLKFIEGLPEQLAFFVRAST